MKLYTFDGAPNPARLTKFMQYKGITLETTQVNLGTEEQLGDTYRAIVPEATVPALILDDGSVLCAVIAIVHYLESRFPERPLLGQNAEERAQVLNWNHRLFSEIFAAAADAFGRVRARRAPAAAHIEGQRNTPTMLVVQIRVVVFSAAGLTLG